MVEAAKSRLRRARHQLEVEMRARRWENDALVAAGSRRASAALEKAGKQRSERLREARKFVAASTARRACDTWTK
jgi:hypothetical protein